MDKNSYPLRQPENIEGSEVINLLVQTYIKLQIIPKVPDRNTFGNIDMVPGHNGIKGNEKANFFAKNPITSSFPAWKYFWRLSGNRTREEVLLSYQLRKNFIAIILWQNTVEKIVFPIVK